VAYVGGTEVGRMCENTQPFPNRASGEAITSWEKHEAEVEEQSYNTEKKGMPERRKMHFIKRKSMQIMRLRVKQKIDKST
jgi:hypothetical protein